MAERRGTWTAWLLPLLAAVLAGGFAYLNSAERVSLHLGLFVLYRVPLALLLFLVFLLGMGSMFLIGLRHDLRVRRLLREYRIQEERRPWEAAPGPAAAAAAWGAATPPWDDPTRTADAGDPPRPGPPLSPPPAAAHRRDDEATGADETGLAAPSSTPVGEEMDSRADRPDVPPS